MRGAPFSHSSAPARGHVPPLCLSFSGLTAALSGEQEAQPCCLTGCVSLRGSHSGAAGAEEGQAGSSGGPGATGKAGDRCPPRSQEVQTLPWWWFWGKDVRRAPQPASDLGRCPLQAGSAVVRDTGAGGQLGLSFPMCKVRIITVASSQGRCEDQMIHIQSHTHTQFLCLSHMQRLRPSLAHSRC